MVDEVKREMFCTNMCTAAAAGVWRGAAGAAPAAQVAVACKEQSCSSSFAAAWSTAEG
jgi:hypothetical protein